MGLFDFFKRNRYAEVEEDVEEELFDEDCELDTVVEDTFAAICELCDDGEHMDVLNSHQRIIYITQTLEQEVNNGGFSQFFYNSSGDFANELTDAFTAIGALKTVAICEQALSPFKGPVPTDRTKRQAMLDRMRADKLWTKCDDAFYEYEEDLEDLNRSYILAHPESFNS